MTRLPALVLAASLLGSIALAAAQSSSASMTESNVPPAVHAVIARMIDRNPSLDSYTTRVHVDLHMLNFPFLAPKLDGTSYFKRPNHSEFVFDRLPSYAKGFEKLLNDVADPLAWQTDWNIEDRGLIKVDGYPAPMIELFMTKKIYSDQTANAIAYVEPKTYELLQVEWNYRNGGKIVMRQSYRDEGAYNLVSQQHVDINIPHIHAVGESQFGTYQINVPVEDTAFKK